MTGSSRSHLEKRPIARVLEPITIGPSSNDASHNHRVAAVVICHGMGQQVKWQTLSELVGSFQEADLLHPSVEPAVRQVRFSYEAPAFFMGRAEFAIRANGNSAESSTPKPVHVYEAYWAPLTEGKISLRQTVAFLLTAGWRGIKQTFRRFYRYGQFDWRLAGEAPPPYKPFRAGASVLLAFIVAMLVVCSLLVMNLSITFGALKELMSNTDASRQEDRELLKALTADVWAFELGVACYLAAILAAFGRRHLLRRRRNIAALSGIVQGLLWVVTGVLFMLTVWIGLGAIPWHYLAYFAGVPILSVGSTLGAVAVSTQIGIQALLSRIPSPISRLDPLYVHATLAWGLLILVAFKVKELLVQYVGDVAIYVTHQTTSSFDDTRDAIKALVRQAVCTVIEKCQYERVIIVGHSLGSVIAYDALNGGLLNDDATSVSGPFVRPLQIGAPLPPSHPPDSPYNFVRRLITFGSPLDKTAYVFRSADASDAAVREGLAVTVQPLLVRPASAGFDWVNIHSPNDIISGRLDYYPRVKNQRDRQADVPIWAHTQFWSNHLLAKTLVDACSDQFTPGFRPGSYETNASQMVGV